jgi:ligand-binding SRPBCC domain-containing protein
VIHVHRSSTRVARPIEEVFAFFSDAANLELITPPQLRFRILTPSPIPMHEGTRIDYELRLMGIPFRWETLISTWDPPHRFVDEQLAGPYRTWVHTHTFTSCDGGTLIEDEVRWSLPFFPFGQVAYPFVARQVRGIFAYRESAINGLMG